MPSGGEGGQVAEGGTVGPTGRREHKWVEFFFFPPTQKRSGCVIGGSRRAGAHPRRTRAPLCAVEEPAVSAHASPAGMELGISSGTLDWTVSVYRAFQGVGGAESIHGEAAVVENGPKV